MAPPRPSTFWCLVLVLAILELAATAVYETDDAIIIDLEAPSEKASSSNNVANSADTSGTRTSRSLASTNEVVFTRQFGAGTWPPVLPVGPCFTSRGVLGRCTSFRQCYPYFKLPELNNWETWILGMYDTCSYFNSNGRQAFGVCCSNPTFPSTPRPGQPARPTPPPVVEAPEPPTATEAPEVATEAPYKPPQPAQPINPSQGAIPPNWPPPIPTHPPDHTIPPLPTHPPSPGWPGLPQPVPTQPVAPPQAPTTTLAPARPPPPQPPTAPAFPWPPPIPTHPTPAPPRPTPPRPTAPTHPAFPVTQPPAAPTQPPTAAAPGTGAILADASCGISDSPRIVGGVQAEKGEFPWIAALFNGGRQFCGGSLIDSTHILTAAHCIAHMTSWDVSRLTVHLGDHNIKTTTEAQHVTKKVKRLVRHKGFDSRTLYNDIAILTLDSPVTFTTAIRPICLPSGSALYTGKEATVTGWGSLRESGPQPAVLQKVTIPIWTNTECRSKYGNAAPGGIVEHFLCAGRAGRDSCSGDSGGPLMVSEGRWTQVGVVSWGIGCGKGQYPGVYTRVTHFLPWIQKNLS